VNNALSTPEHRLSTASDVGRQLNRGDRTVLRALLARFTVAEPTMERLIAWADQYPDRWVASLSALGRLAGLAEHHVVDHGVKDIADMSDAEVEERLAQLAQRVTATDVVIHDQRRHLPKLIEGTVAPADVDPLT